MTDNERLAELLFPNISWTPQQYEEQYPARQLPEGARVTRFSPSPTGYLHIGGLFAAMTAPPHREGDKRRILPAH